MVFSGTVSAERTVDVAGESVLLDLLLGDAPPMEIPEVIVDFLLVKDGDDIDFHWTPDPDALGGYRLFGTDVAADIPVLRSETPGVSSFLETGASEPLPVSWTDGVRLGELYYQVLGVASDGITEGPN